MLGTSAADDRNSPASEIHSREIHSRGILNRETRSSNGNSSDQPSQNGRGGEIVRIAQTKPAAAIEVDVLHDATRDRLAMHGDPNRHRPPDHRATNLSASMSTTNRARWMI